MLRERIKTKHFYEVNLETNSFVSESTFGYTISIDSMQEESNNIAWIVVYFYRSNTSYKRIKITLCSIDALKLIVFKYVKTWLETSQKL